MKIILAWIVLGSIGLFILLSIIKAFIDWIRNDDYGSGQIVTVVVIISFLILVIWALNTVLN